MTRYPPCPRNHDSYFPIDTLYGVLEHMSPCSDYDIGYGTAVLEAMLLALERPTNHMCVRAGLSPGSLDVLQKDTKCSLVVFFSKDLGGRHRWQGEEV